MSVVQFRTKARVQWTDAARWRIYQTVDGRYRVVESRSLYGLPTVWYAQVYVRESWGWCWDLLGRHRTRRAAEQHVIKEAAKDARTEAKNRRRTRAQAGGRTDRPAGGA